jgi:hypothetical protein
VTEPSLQGDRVKVLECEVMIELPGREGERERYHTDVEMSGHHTRGRLCRSGPVALLLQSVAVFIGPLS